MDVRGKGVFLTGGATGIGSSLMDALVSRGAKVFFCDVNEEAAAATQQRLTEQYPGCDVTFAKCDVSDGPQLVETFQAAVSKFGAVELCINNAGIMGEDIWERVIAVNQVAVIRCSLLALEHMRQDRGGLGGVIINTSSVNGLYYGQSLFPVYMATKGAVLGFTTSWANNPDQPQHGVRWGAVCPDATVTPMTEESREGRVLKAPIKPAHLPTPTQDRSKWLRPDDVASAFMTLIDDADSNGDVIKVYRDRLSEDPRPPVTQQVLTMDKSKYPVTSLIVRKTIVTPVA